MFFRCLAALPLLATVACAELGMERRSPVEVQAASEHSIVLGPVGSEDDSAAKALAEAHCAKHGRAARLPRLVGPSTVHYQCLP